MIEVLRRKLMLKDSQQERFKLVGTHRKTIGIAMISLGLVYFVENLVLWHGWLWIWTSNSSNNFSFSYLSMIGFVLLDLSIVAVICGAMLFQPMNEPINAPINESERLHLENLPIVEETTVETVEVPVTQEVPYSQKLGARAPISVKLEEPRELEKIAPVEAPLIPKQETPYLKEAQEKCKFEHAYPLLRGALLTAIGAILLSLLIIPSALNIKTDLALLFYSNVFGLPIVVVSVIMIFIGVYTMTKETPEEA